MQKLVYFVMLLAAMFCPAISRGADAVNAPKKGVIRVKLQPEVALKVGNAPLTQSRGAVTTGITPLDRAARDVKAVSIRPMLPYVQKFARQRAKYGLDRWYVVNFDESVSPEEARKIFATTAGVERSEIVTPCRLRKGIRDSVSSTAPQWPRLRPLCHSTTPSSLSSGITRISATSL